jgi:hypothetical protein
LKESAPSSAPRTMKPVKFDPWPVVLLGSAQLKNSVSPEILAVASRSDCPADGSRQVGRDNVRLVSPTSAGALPA